MTFYTKQFQQKWMLNRSPHKPLNLFERSCEDVQFLKNIGTGDESWVYGYDPETKQ